MFFFFKQKTSYEMRISDWSSDVCSSDLRTDWRADGRAGAGREGKGGSQARHVRRAETPIAHAGADAGERNASAWRARPYPGFSPRGQAGLAIGPGRAAGDRKSVALGPGVSVVLESRGCRKSKNTN